MWVVEVEVEAGGSPSWPTFWVTRLRLGSPKGLDFYLSQVTLAQLSYFHDQMGRWGG